MNRDFPVASGPTLLLALGEASGMCCSSSFYPGMNSNRLCCPAQPSRHKSPSPGCTPRLLRDCEQEAPHTCEDTCMGETASLTMVDVTLPPRKNRVLVTVCPTSFTMYHTHTPKTDENWREKHTTVFHYKVGCGFSSSSIIL